MHRHDGSTGARARSAQIRAAHDYEANRLEAMHGAGGSGRDPRTAWLRAPVARLLARHTSREVPGEIGAAEAAAGPR